MAKEPTHTEPVRLPRKNWPSFESWSLVAFSLGTGSIIFLTVLNLISDSGALGFVKAGIFAAITSLVSYGVNRFAIRTGAELAASGFITAGIASVVSILAVGCGLFPSSYAGLVINEVDELRLQEHARKLGRYAGARNKVAIQATRLIPVIRANKQDLEQARACEERESCLSHRGSGGRGIVTKVLEERVRRAEVIAQLLEKGNANRQSLLDELNKWIARFQTTLNQTDLSLKERRQKLIELDGKIDQTISVLEEALPVSLLRAYTIELKAGIKIPGRPVATTGINALLTQHAGSLELVLSTLNTGGQQQPVFPARSGVSETFAYMGHFLPIAALTACVELVFPLTVWVLAFLGHIWHKHTIDPTPHSRQRRAVGRPVKTAWRAP